MPQLEQQPAVPNMMLTMWNGIDGALRSAATSSLRRASMARCPVTLAPSGSRPRARARSAAAAELFAYFFNFVSKLIYAAAAVVFDVDGGPRLQVIAANKAACVVRDDVQVVHESCVPFLRSITMIRRMLVKVKRFLANLKNIYDFVMCRRFWPGRGRILPCLRLLPT